MSLVHRIAVLAIAVPATLQAQSHPLVGTWAIEYPGGMRNDNGTVTVTTVKGRLTVEQAGDSLVASLATDPPAGMPARPASRFATKRTDGDPVFVQTVQAKMQMNGEEMTRTAYTTWTFKVSGDSVSGTLTRQIEGVDIQSPTSEFKGARAKS